MFKFWGECDGNGVDLRIIDDYWSEAIEGEICGYRRGI